MTPASEAEYFNAAVAQLVVACVHDCFTAVKAIPASEAARMAQLEAARLLWSRYSLAQHLEPTTEDSTPCP